MQLIGATFDAGTTGRKVAGLLVLDRFSNPAKVAGVLQSTTNDALREHVGQRAGEWVEAQFGAHDTGLTVEAHAKPELLARVAPYDVLRLGSIPGMKDGRVFALLDRKTERIVAVGEPHGHKGFRTVDFQKMLIGVTAVVGAGAAAGAFSGASSAAGTAAGGASSTGAAGAGVGSSWLEAQVAADLAASHAAAQASVAAAISNPITGLAAFDFAVAGTAAGAAAGGAAGASLGTAGKAAGSSLVSQVGGSLFDKGADALQQLIAGQIAAELVPAKDAAQPQMQAMQAAGAKSPAVPLLAVGAGLLALFLVIR